MSTSPARRPAGTPAGGQFAPSAHAESSATLSDSLGLATALKPSRPKRPPFDDPEIAGWTDDDVVERLGFEDMDAYQRSHWTLGGPFSITAEVRDGEITFRTHDMRSGRSIRVATKRAATRIAKIIEDDYRGAGRG